MESTRRLAYDSRAFWETHAPFASATELAKRYPVSGGGLSYSGWAKAIIRSRTAYPDLPWPATSRGKRLPVPETWPDPIYDPLLREPQEPRRDTYGETV